MAVLNIPSEQLFLSKEEFCRVCHIGKQTALHLIETGVVQAIDTKKKTNRYLIPRASVEQYLSDRIEHPERYGHPTRTYGIYRAEVGNRIRELLDERMKDAEDLLDAEYVANLIGYQKLTIYKWRKKYKLHFIPIKNQFFIPKAVLLDFIATPEFYNIPLKSQKHYELIWEASHEG